ncbi:glutaredoxin 3 [Acetobacteraceae bacterium]|nr:glutaredoxin 3 [Acetobacteraceae bacterium]
MHKVQIYTQPGCPFCQRALALLEDKGIPFEHIDAPRGSEAREAVIKRSGGQKTVPVIFIDGELIGGCDALLSLENSGRLNTILGME